MRPTPGRITSPTRPARRHQRRCIVEQARGARRERGVSGWLSEPRPAHLRRGDDRRRVRARCGAPSTRPGPRAPPTRGRARALGQPRGDGGHPAAAARGRAAAGFRQLRRLRARHPHGAQRARGDRLPARAGARGARRGRRPSSPSSRRSPAARSQPGTSPSTPSGCSASAIRSRRRSCAPYFPLPRVLAGLFEVAERLFGVRIRERTGVPVWHPDVRYFEIQSAAGAPLRQLLPGCLRAPAQAQRRLDGRLRRPQGARAGARRCRWPTWCAIPAARGRRARRCSRTMTW